MKVCKKCELNKPERDFYKKGKSLMGSCKICHKKDVGFWRTKNKIRITETSRKYFVKNSHKILQKVREEYKKNPQKIRARQRLSRAVKQGKLEKQKTCSLCNKKESEAHHPDYSKPLEVIWLCHKCHQRLHFGELDHEEMVNEILMQLLIEFKDKKIGSQKIFDFIGRNFNLKPKNWEQELKTVINFYKFVSDK